MRKESGKGIRQESRLLIVDDSEIIRNRLRETLIESGFDGPISEAECVKDALQIFSEFNPTLVILDIQLNNENGISLLKPFRNINPDVRIIMLTNFPQEQYRKKCFELGVDFFFSKYSESQEAIETCKMLAGLANTHQD